MLKINRIYIYRKRDSFFFEKTYNKFSIWISSSSTGTLRRYSKEGLPAVSFIFFIIFEYSSQYSAVRQEPQQQQRQRHKTTHTKKAEKEKREKIKKYILSNMMDCVRLVVENVVRSLLIIHRLGLSQKKKKKKKNFYQKKEKWRIFLTILFCWRIRYDVSNRPTADNNPRLMAIQWNRVRLSSYIPAHQYLPITIHYYTIRFGERFFGGRGGRNQL